jgi:glycosyltransferase involved in cell wall biosynthesis
LYPPLLDPKLISMSKLRTQPFIREKIKLGYFGGLNAEKGANKLLALFDMLDLPYEIHVGGKGELATKFRELAGRDPRKFYFYGFTSEKQLITLLCDMDILVNPHTDIGKLDDGVFPFKLFEYIASGAFVITSPLPFSDVRKLENLCYFNGKIEDLYNKIIDAPSIYNADKQKELQGNVEKYFGYETMFQRLKIAIKQIEVKKINIIG